MSALTGWVGAARKAGGLAPVVASSLTPCVGAEGSMERKMADLAAAGSTDERSRGIVQSTLTFVREEAGATAIEYGMLCSLIAVALIGTLTLFGEAVARPYDIVAAAIDIF
jgi:pilus assembly protein Flp/PilA